MELGFVLECGESPLAPSIEGRSVETRHRGQPEIKLGRSERHLQLALRLLKPLPLPLLHSIEGEVALCLSVHFVDYLDRGRYMLNPSMPCKTPPLHNFSKR